MKCRIYSEKEKQVCHKYRDNGNNACYACDFQNSKYIYVIHNTSDYSHVLKYFGNEAQAKQYVQELKDKHIIPQVTIKHKGKILETVSADVIWNLE